MISFFLSLPSLNIFDNCSMQNIFFNDSTLVSLMEATDGMFGKHCNSGLFSSQTIIRSSKMDVVVHYDLYLSDWLGKLHKGEQYRLVHRNLFLPYHDILIELVLCKQKYLMV